MGFNYKKTRRNARRVGHGQILFIFLEESNLQNRFLALRPD